MKSGFTYNQIAHLNAELRERDLPYKINYRDRTTAGIQELGVCASIGKEGTSAGCSTGIFSKRGNGGGIFGERTGDPRGGAQ